MPTTQLSELHQTMISQVQAAFASPFDYHTTVKHITAINKEALGFVCHPINGIKRNIIISYNEGIDAYDCAVYKIKALKIISHEKFDGLYCDQLGDLFVNQ